MSESPKRRRLVITGQVQGVGFRPFVYRTALDHALTGAVRNTPEGVIIEIQGPSGRTAAFETALVAELPPLARIVTLDAADAEPLADEAEFSILASTAGKGHTVLISPDVATCPDCERDLRDPDGRRHRYPFTNCTNCGPRYTITRAIPYDRPQTSMACFPLCQDCRAEYENPLDRRFHAQPNACPVCGPRIRLTDPRGCSLLPEEYPEAFDPLATLAELLAGGSLAAIKGLGGFHLACDASDRDAVARLREHKSRPDKPLAVMVPDLAAARLLAETSPAEEAWLTGIKRPIVLVPKRAPFALADNVAPDTDGIGLMLPYTPLHIVLFEHLARMLEPGRVPALVMTSGNAGGEPISLGNREALRRLGNIADVFLLHDRDILIRTDDSVLRVNLDSGEPIMLRRARGFTPSPVFLAEDGPCVLGVGPELKCTLTLTKGSQAFPSQHLGDMVNLETFGFHREILDHLQSILQVRPEAVVRDLHPDYLTSGLADELGAELGVPVLRLQHHYAHIHAVLAENRHPGPALGIALDGTGYGEDGTIWGGEFLFVDSATAKHRRLGHFTPFALPGGEAAVRQPWRIAQSLLREIGEQAPPAGHSWPWLKEFERPSRLLPQLLQKSINSPLTSSCGRLFDGVSALLGLCSAISYEGQAAILLEKAQDRSANNGYPCPFQTPEEVGPHSGTPLDIPARLDVHTLFRHVRDDLRAGTSASVAARRFHLGLVNGVADLAEHLCRENELRRVALSGGVFQNLTIAVELPRALRARGLEVLVHTELPPNDGCISLGQAVWGRRQIA